MYEKLEKLRNKIIKNKKNRMYETQNYIYIL